MAVRTTEPVGLRERPAWKALEAHFAEVKDVVGFVRS